MAASPEDWRTWVARTDPEGSRLTWTLDRAGWQQGDRSLNPSSYNSNVYTDLSRRIRRSRCCSVAGGDGDMTLQQKNLLTQPDAEQRAELGTADRSERKVPESLPTTTT